MEKGEEGRRKKNRRIKEEKGGSRAEGGQKRAEKIIEGRNCLSLRHNVEVSRVMEEENTGGGGHDCWWALARTFRPQKISVREECVCEGVGDRATFSLSIDDQTPSIHFQQPQLPVFAGICWSLTQLS